MLVLMFCGANSLYSQELAFPGAEGFGRFATGGRGGFVYTVTNLNDAGEGSLRKGILKHGPRIIIFAVSGTIDLKSNLDINRGDLTILGQTAPGGGVTIKGYPVAIKADNVIIRFLRFRMGDENQIADDALKAKGVENVIIDHCSISWATDENASFYQNRNFTFQWNIISEALNSSVHEKGDHGYGGIWGGENVSFHHNLIASNNSRNPRFSGSKTTENLDNELVDFRNNVIYNWGDNSIYGGENGKYNIINNYFKPGPATSSSKKERILEPYAPYGKFYIEGNFMEGFQRVTWDNWNGGVQAENFATSKAAEPFDIANNVKTHSAKEAFKVVLEYAGASLKRDAIDKRIIKETELGIAVFGDGIIDSQSEVGGWPELEAGILQVSSSGDGIPDCWKKANGWDPDVKNLNRKILSKEYDPIELYANYLVKEIIRSQRN